MSLTRRLILALALMAGLSPALAQAPPPVPALPDTERRTSYTIAGTTCACAVNFALYGDSTDYQNWVEVFLGGVRVNFNDASFGWTITSPTGPLGSIPRPVTDAVLTFNSVQTGTVQIVGARRPRRVSQFPENRGVAARDLNQAFTDVIAQNRETWDKTNDVTGRAVLGLPGEALALLPPAATRANKYFTFDGSGNPTTTLPAASGSGNVTSSTAVVGHVPTYSNVAGTIIQDSGFLPVQPSTCSTHQYVSQIAGSGVPACLQPQISDLQNINANTVLGNGTGSSGPVTALGLPSYTVTSLGAVCDNSTDDRVAIVAAFAAIPSGATLVFPSTKCAVKSLTAGGTNPHIFVLTKPVHISFPNGGGISKSTVTGILFDIQTDGVTIDGSPTAVIDGGWATTVYTAFDIAVSTNDYDTVATARNFIKISDVQFTNWAHGGVFVFYFTNFSIQNIIVNNIAYGGIFCAACTNGQIVNNRVSNIWASTGPDIPVPNPVQYGNKYGIAVSTNLAVSTPSTNVVVANNVVNNVPTWECYDAHSAQNVIFSGNVGINCRAGISISSPSPLDSTDIKIDSNKITCLALGSAIYNGSSGLSVGGAGIGAVGLSSGNVGARLSIQNNIVSGCGPDNTTLEGTIGAIYVALFVGTNIQGNVVYNPIYRAFNFGDFVWANVHGNWTENVTAGPAAAGAYVFDITGANEKLNFGENSADGGGSFTGYNVTAQNATFFVAMSRSNVFTSGGSLTLYNGGTITNRTDLGASAP